jgi:hypothetical protein
LKSFRARTRQPVCSKTLAATLNAVLAAQMQHQLLLAVEGDQHGHGDAAPGALVEARPSPDLPPGITRQEVLELFGKWSL